MIIVLTVIMLASSYVESSVSIRQKPIRQKQTRQKSIRQKHGGPGGLPHGKGLENMCLGLVRLG